MIVRYWAGMPDYYQCPYKDGEEIHDSLMHEAVDNILAAKLNVMIFAHSAAVDLSPKILFIDWKAFQTR